jgi:hypothetical protein
MKYIKGVLQNLQNKLANKVAKLTDDLQEKFILNFIRKVLKILNDTKFDRENISNISNAISEISKENEKANEYRVQQNIEYYYKPVQENVVILVKKMLNMYKYIIKYNRPKEAGVQSSDITNDEKKNIIIKWVIINFEKLFIDSFTEAEQERIKKYIDRRIMHSWHPP